MPKLPVIRIVNHVLTGIVRAIPKQVSAQIVRCFILQDGMLTIVSYDSGMTKNIDIPMSINIGLKMLSGNAKIPVVQIIINKIVVPLAGMRAHLGWTDAPFVIFMTRAHWVIRLIT